MRNTDWLLISGLVLFLAGAGLVLLAMAGGDSRIFWLGLGGMVGATAALGLAAWKLHTRVDRRRIEAEQRLWRSGALGRSWLKLRSTLLRR